MTLAFVYSLLTSFAVHCCSEYQALSSSQGALIWSETAMKQLVMERELTKETAIWFPWGSNRRLGFDYFINDHLITINHMIQIVVIKMLFCFFFKGKMKLCYCFIFKS